MFGFASRLPLSALLILLAAPAIVTGVRASSFQDTGEPIVVKGTRLEADQARQRAIDFVRRSGVATGEKQVARWVIPVCIKVIGISDSQSIRVKNLMYSIAQAAGVPTASSNCDPTITVTFVSDPGPLVAKIAASRPRQFDEVPRAEREQLLHGNAPVRWWYATQMLDRDGVGSNNISAPWIGNGNTGETPGSGGTSISLPTSDSVTATQQYNGGSNVRTPTIRSLYAANVIIDATRIGDAGLDSVARYAAMVAFAELQANNPPPDSILRLFQPEGTETQLTDWDLAFLKSLYQMPLDRRSRIQRGHLVKALLDERVGSASSRGR